MKEYNVRIVTIEDVKRFVATVMGFDFDMDGRGQCHI